MHTDHLIMQAEANKRQIEPELVTHVYWLSDQRHPELQPLRVTEAREHALDKFGMQHHDPHRWMTILTEEVGEAAKEINDLQELVDAHGVKGGHTAVLLRRHVANLKAELAQVAAMAIHFLSDLDGYPARFDVLHPEWPEAVEDNDPKRWWK